MRRITPTRRAAAAGTRWDSGRRGFHGDIALHRQARQRTRTDVGKLQLCQQMLRLGGNRARQDARAGFRTLRGHHNTRHGLTLDPFQYTARLPCREECEPYMKLWTNV